MFSLFVEHKIVFENRKQSFLGLAEKNSSFSVIESKYFDIFFIGFTHKMVKI